MTKDIFQKIAEHFEAAMPELRPVTKHPVDLAYEQGMAAWPRSENPYPVNTDECQA